jgi:hypothetical protein
MVFTLEFSIVDRLGVTFLNSCLSYNVTSRY